MNRSLHALLGYIVIRLVLKEVLLRELTAATLAELV
jgi:hypothetical protein